MSRALAHIDHHYKEVGLDTETIAQAAYISKRQLERLFRQFLNTSPSQYVKDLSNSTLGNLIIKRQQKHPTHCRVLRLFTATISPSVF
ncbi:AraC family transcriptional regulator [Vibrio chagasii]|nr:AraC family transcriptional regulator [Vibrio chagasii]